VESSSKSVSARQKKSEDEMKCHIDRLIKEIISCSGSAVNIKDLVILIVKKRQNKKREGKGSMVRIIIINK